MNRFLQRTFSSVIERAIVKQRRKKVARYVFDACSGVVQEGPFSGMKLDPDVHWGKGDLASKIYGFYEREVLELLLAHPERTALINLGCADGYYGIGLVRAEVMEHALCYDISAKAREVTAATAALNGVDKKISLYGEASASCVSDAAEQGYSAGKLLVLSDIEGAEFEVFDAGMVQALSAAVVVIELHGMLQEGGLKKERELLERFAATHEVRVVRAGARDTSAITSLDDLDENDRWLLCSEGRKGRGQWLYAVPRSAVSE